MTDNTPVSQVNYKPDTALIATEQTAVNEPQARQVSKSVNVYGQNLVKGSSIIGSGLFESIGAAYSNLTYHPLAITCMVIGTLGLLAEVNNNNGPLERMYNSTMTYAKDDTHPRLLNALATAMAWIFNFLVSIKIPVLVTTLFWSVYLAKPSRRNLYISLGLTFLGIFSGIDLWDLVLISQCYFLYTQIRTPWMKFLILVITFIGLIIGFESMSSYAGLEAMEGITRVKRDAASVPITSYKLRGNSTGKY